MADISMDLYLAYEDGYKKGKAETEAYLLHCGDVTPVTNADRIRAMTDEELASYLTGVWYSFEEMPGMCDVCGKNSIQNCCDCWLDWLKQEVDDDSK